MSILVNDEYVRFGTRTPCSSRRPTDHSLLFHRFDFYRLRTSYLTTTKDGVGERLIAVNGAVINSSGFRAAGWDTNQNEAKRTYSPPIPSAIAAEYFQAPPRSAGLPPPGFGDDEEEGGMVTGGGGGDMVAFGVSSRRRRRREQEDQDSSDLSDESDEDTEGQRYVAYLVWL
jgi:target of rapamycin complex 2 subunit MAPKAP1